MASAPLSPSHSQSVDVEDQPTEGSIEPTSTPALGRRNWLNLVAYVANTLVTYLSIAGIWGETNSDLSKKYQTLVTPAGWAFSIWGIIFIWEGAFVVAQLFRRFRQSKVVEMISPWWWALCTCQIAWTFAFAQDCIPVALALMLGILVSLLGMSWSTDGLTMSVSEYFALRAPLSLQLGWIIAASVVNINVQADANRCSQETLLTLAVASNAAVLAVVTFFTFGVKSADPLVGLVAAWAFAGIGSELGNPTNLNDPSRFNASKWSPLILTALRSSAFSISCLSLTLAAVAAYLRVSSGRRSSFDGKASE